MAMEMYHFIHATKPYHLTIKDIVDLKKGDTLDVVIWDRNWEEYWAAGNAQDKIPYDAETFFKENRWTIEYLGDMKWNLNAPWGDEFEHPVHLDVSGLETYWTWCEIEEDGFIHITNEEVDNGSSIPSHWKPKHIHWSDFPANTRVGWRGPIMLWDYLKNAPNIYKKKGYYGKDLD